MLELTRFWNRLPAFRAVAESEHLPTAAQQLGVSASALSRTIRQLEESLEIELFLRAGGRLHLTAVGAELLGALRDSMRVLDDGLERISRQDQTRHVHLSIAGPYGTTIPGVLQSLRSEHPHIVPVVHNYEQETVNANLLAGNLDLVVTPDPQPHTRLLVERLVDLSAGIYCGPDHPLYHEETVSAEQVARHPFVAPVLSESAPRADGWPPELRRSISVYTMQLSIALELCAAGNHLAVFPDIVPRNLALHRNLRRLPVEVIPQTSLFVVRRSRLSRQHDVADRFIERLVLHWQEPMVD